MLLPMRVAQGVREGRITLAFRRWEQPRVVAGRTQLTAAGIVGFDEVTEVLDLDAITDAEAVAAGFPDAEHLRRLLASPPASRGPRGGKGGGRVFRIRMAHVGEDPRVALRAAVPDAAELADLSAAVARLDSSRRAGAWTRPILEWIAAHPGVRADHLAEHLHRDLRPMKADIRRLKALGLTESLRVGYRLSPRGRAYLESLP